MDDFYDDYDDEPMCWECAYCDGCFCELDEDEFEIDPNGPACAYFVYGC